MEDGIPGSWYDYLNISSDDKQRIADLHKENAILGVLAAGLAAVLILTLIALLLTLYKP